MLRNMYSRTKIQRKIIPRKRSPFQNKPLSPSKNVEFFSPKKPTKFSKKTNRLYRKIIESRNLFYLFEMVEDDREVVLELLRKNSDFYELVKRFDNIPIKYYTYSEDEIGTTYYYLNGPKSFCCMTNKNKDKIIYLIGEQHIITQSCESLIRYDSDETYVYDNIKHKPYPQFSEEAYEIVENNRGGPMVYLNIEDVLYDVYKNTPAFIDIFIESDFLYYRLKGEHYNFRGTIDRIIEKLLPLKFGRLHYVDIRGTMALKNDAFRFPPQFYMTIALDVLILEKIDIEIRKENAKIFLEAFESYFNPNIDYETWKNNIYNITIDSELLKKELSRSYIGDELIEHFNVNINEYLEKDDYEMYKQHYEKVVKYVTGLINTTKKYYKSGTKQLGLILGHLIKISSPILDMYTLARVFKKFGLPRQHHQTIEPTNVIIYAGDYHIKSMIKFLETLGYYRHTIGTELCLNCVFTGMKLPFFMI